MREHKLKCWPSDYEAVQDGRKLFVLCFDDHDFAVGDVLVLEKWDPNTREYFWDGFGWGAKIMSLRVEITYVLEGERWGLQRGFVAMGLRAIKEEK